jgi:hypothetical protein
MNDTILTSRGIGLLVRKQFKVHLQSGQLVGPGEVLGYCLMSHLANDLYLSLD